jgi:diacylglycerol kinase (ATP)
MDDSGSKSGLAARRKGLVLGTRRAELGLIARIICASGDSWTGLRAAWRTQHAFRCEIYVLVVLTPVAWWLGKNGVERALLIGSGLFLAIVELLNSAIETAVDRIGNDYHELSGRAKDMGSAAVLCSIIMAGMVWLLVLVPG